MLEELALVVLLVLANGVFAGAEIAIISVRRGPMTGLLATRGRRACSLETLRSDSDRFLATVQQRSATR